MTEAGNVAMSRRAALVANYLSMSAVGAFRRATEGRFSPEQVEQPYRDWLIDVRNIPVEQRASVVDVRTGERVTRDISRNI